MNAKVARTLWNQVSASYRNNRTYPVDSVHYGPWAPPESELQLLGDVRGLRILELGCGGGECAVAFARQGALVAGLDVSDAQLAYAQRLAAAEGVAVEFVQGSADDLQAFATAAWEMVFSVYALPYAPDIGRCLAECARVLRPGGRLVFSLDHPLRDCFVDVEEESLAVYPVRSYFDPAPVRWRWPGQAAVWMETAHFTLAQWFDLLNEHSLRVVRLVEPMPPADLLDELWPEDGALAALRCIPQTVIFVAQKA